MPCNACSFVLLKQGIADLLYLLLCLLSCGISLCLLVFPFRLDLLCNGQAFLPADFFCHPCCLVAHKGSIIDLSVQADTVGDDVNVSVVGVLVRYCHPLVVVKSHSLGKQMGYPHKFGHRQLFFVLRCYTDFNAEELILAPCVVIADHFHFLIDCLWLPAAKIVEGKQTAEFALSEDIVQSRAAVRYRLTFSYHFLLDLRPYIPHHPHENKGHKTA